MITNYTELQTSIANWIQRSDLSSVIPEFVQLAEDRLNNDIKARDMETIVSIDTTAGSAYINLPSGVLDVERVALLTSPKRTLTPLSADEIIAMYPNATTGQPANYAVINNQIQLGPIPDGVYSVEVVYNSTIPSLISNATNWLLARNPSVYLWACLIEAAAYIQDADKMTIAQQKYQEAFNRLNLTDWCTVSTPRVRSR